MSIAVLIIMKNINENDEAKKVFEDLSLTSNVYKDYVSNIDDNSQKILAKNKEGLEKTKTGFFDLLVSSNTSAIRIGSGHAFAIDFVW